MKAKKLFLAGALACSTLTAPMMTMLNATPVFAETAATTGTIINDTDHPYDAYQIFSGTQGTNDADLANVVWGTGINYNDETFKKDVKNLLGITDDKDYTAANVAAKLAEKAKEDEKDPNRDNDQTAKDFARLAYAAKSTTKTEISAGTKKGDGTITPSTKADMPSGYYLMVDSSNPASTETDTWKNLALLQLTNKGPLNITKKTDKPRVDKQVSDEKNETNKDAAHPGEAGFGTDNDYGETADHEIGEVFNFKLIADIPNDPNMNEYKAYKLVFHDSMSNGLKLVKDENKNPYFEVRITSQDPAVTIDPKTDTNKNGYILTFDEKQDGTTEITVSFTDLVATLKDKGINTLAGTKIEVVYRAELTEDAATFGPGLGDQTLVQNNKVHLEYTRNPNVGGEGETGKTPDDTVFVGTYKLPNTKTDGENKPLGGAGFKLYYTRENNGKTEKVYAYFEKVDDVKDSEGKITTPQKYMFKGWALNGEGVPTGFTTEFTSDETGEFSVYGVDAGTYTLEETTVPAGYNKAEDKVLTLTATHTETVNNNVETGKTNVTFQHNAQATGTTVPNYKGSTLPETGGMGTTMLYTAGGLLVAGAALFFVTNKRMKKEED